MKWNLAINEVKAMQSDVHARGLRLLSRIEDLVGDHGAVLPQEGLDHLFGEFASDALDAVWETSDGLMFRYAQTFDAKFLVV